MWARLFTEEGKTSVDTSPVPSSTVVEVEATDVQGGVCPSDTQVMCSGGQKALSKYLLFVSVLLP